MTPQPPVVGDENREDPREAVTVGRVAVVLPLRPRHNVGSRARRVEALEALFAVEGADLTADKPVGVLAGIEVIQGALEVEGAAVEEQRMVGDAQGGRRLVHQARRRADELVLGELADALTGGHDSASPQIGGKHIFAAMRCASGESGCTPLASIQRL